MPSDSPSLSTQVDRLNLHEQAQSPSETSSTELVAVVDDLINQLSSKFSNLSGELIGKMDEMSQRLDNLEATIHAGNGKGDAEAEGSK